MENFIDDQFKDPQASHTQAHSIDLLKENLTLAWMFLRVKVAWI